MSIDAKQAHRQLAIFLSLFLIVHFATHFMTFAGVEQHGATLQLGRAVYQVPLVELALVAAFTTQIALGLILLRRIGRRVKRGLWHWVQVLSGCYLVYFIVMHTAAALTTRLALDLDTNIYWAAGTLVLAPIKYGFAPYYVLAVTALVSHLIAALHFRGSRKWHTPALAIGPIAGLLIIAGYGGAISIDDLPPEYRDYFAMFPGVDG